MDRDVLRTKLRNAHFVLSAQAGLKQPAPVKWEKSLGVSFMEASQDPTLVENLSLIARTRGEDRDARALAGVVLAEIFKAGVSGKQDSQIREAAHTLAAHNLPDLKAVGQYMKRELGIPVL